MSSDYKYMVCTRCLTYNQKPYIEDALRGFAMQRITFPAVTVVVDDASTDGEQELLRQWASTNLDFHADGAYERDPDHAHVICAPLKENQLHTFVILLLRENHYKKKSKRTFYAEWIDNAKYLALCEGDDYWTHPLKLQKQVDFLETHPKYSLCFHNAQTYSLYNERFIDKFHLPASPRKYTARKLFVSGWFVPTASILQRQVKLPESLLEYWRKECPQTGSDIMMLLYSSSQGDFWYLGDTMSVYRFGTKGSATDTNKKTGRSKSHAHYLKLLRYTNFKLFHGKYSFWVLFRYMSYHLHRIIRAR